MFIWSGYILMQGNYFHACYKTVGKIVTFNLWCLKLENFLQGQLCLFSLEHVKKLSNWDVWRWLFFWIAIRRKFFFFFKHLERDKYFWSEEKPNISEILRFERCNCNNSSFSVSLHAPTPSARHGMGRDQARGRL